MRQSALLAKATDVLRATQQECPYNNISNAFILRGQVPDPRFGGDCLYQAKVFGERLRAVAPEAVVRFHNQEGEGTAGHIVPFVGEGDERAAFEITSLAAEPIVLERVRGRASARSIPTLPLAPLGNRSLHSFWIPQAATLHMLLQSSTQGTMLHHRIATDASIQLPDTAHPIDEFMCMQPRKPLKLQILDTDSCKTTVCMNPTDGAMSIRRVGSSETLSGTRRFEEELARVATTLAVTRAQLLEFFHEGLAMERGLQGLE
jgi:hypothetical protein